MNTAATLKTALHVATCLSVIAASGFIIWKAVQPPPPAPPAPIKPKKYKFKYVEGRSLRPVHCDGFVTGFRCAALVWDATAQARVRCPCRDWTTCTLELFRAVAGGKKPTCVAHKAEFESLGFEVAVVGSETT